MKAAAAVHQEHSALFDSIVNTAAVADLCSSIEEARGLPNEAFTTDAFLALEREHLFPRCWLHAGRLSEVPNRGDLIPIEVGGRPLILVHGHDDKVRVFHNVCPHRGARLAPRGCEGVQRITCPYHAWAYHLDGTLAARPHYFGPEHHDLQNGERNADAASLPRLTEVRSQQWFDWVFVNLDGTAPPFEQQFEPVVTQLSAYALDEYRFREAITFEFACNWKLALENWADLYHIFKIHPDLDTMIEPQTRTGMSVDGILTHNTYSVPQGSRTKGLPPALGAKHMFGKSSFAHIFPSMGYSLDATNLVYASFTPLDAGNTRMDMFFYFPEHVMAAPKYDEPMSRFVAWWMNLNGEDEEVCHLMHLGRQSPAYDGGRFCPYWDVATPQYHRRILETMLGT